jgi:VanZ family protein
MEKLKKWIAVIIWAGLIFYFSSIPYLESGLPTFWDLILRKMAHMAEFGALNYLIWNASKNVFSAGSLSFLYAIGDEFHQTFVPGRHGKALDVLIDSIGIAISILFILRPRRFS